MILEHRLATSFKGVSGKLVLRLKDQNLNQTLPGMISPQALIRSQAMTEIGELSCNSDTLLTKRP